MQKPFDGYVTVGFGCDFYFPWFKFCPEIRYQLGFANVITPSSKRPELPAQNAFYTDAISRLRNHMITLTFNFE